MTQREIIIYKLEINMYVKEKEVIDNFNNNNKNILIINENIPNTRIYRKNQPWYKNYQINFKGSIKNNHHIFNYQQ